MTRISNFCAAPSLRIHLVESVVLLDIEPEKQKTRVDFAATETFLGIRPVCVTKIKKRGRQLFYDRDGRDVRIERIYNRVIFDELSQRPDLTYSFVDTMISMSRGLQTDRTGISGSASIPCRFSKPNILRQRFVHEFPSDQNIKHYVLKPLYSFAGHGVDMEPTREKIAELQNPHEWIFFG